MPKVDDNNAKSRIARYAVFASADPASIAEAVLRAKFGDFADLPGYRRINGGGGFPAFMQKMVIVYSRESIDEQAVIAAIKSRSAEFCGSRGCREFSYFNGMMPPGNMVTMRCPCSAKYVKIAPNCGTYASGDDRISFTRTLPNNGHFRVIVVVERERDPDYRLVPFSDILPE